MWPLILKKKKKLYDDYWRDTKKLHLALPSCVIWNLLSGRDYQDAFPLLLLLVISIKIDIQKIRLKSFLLLRS